MQNIKYRYSELYLRFAEDPELAKFRRHLELWCWILNGKLSKIDKKLLACNDVIADKMGVARKGSIFMITDFRRDILEAESGQLPALINDLETDVRDYSKDLLIASQVANLPVHHKIHARQLAKTEGVFEHDVYIPTGEHASMYLQVPSHPETCALRGFESQNFGPSWVIDNVERVSEWLRNAINWVLRRQTDTGSMPQEYVTDTTVRTIMNLVTALYVPIVLAGSLAVLSSLKSDLLRIVVLGAFGILLTISMMVVAPTIKRNEIFAITAAYFAVGGVFIGSKSQACRVVGA